jgi:hypothetical protein
MISKPTSPTAAHAVHPGKVLAPPAGDPGSTTLLTPAAAAAMLGVTPKALERWRGTGAGPVFVRLSAKSVRYRPADIAAFVEGRLRASTAAA